MTCQKYHLWHQHSTLVTIVQDRGVLNCGIEDLREGDINLNEFNIDQCRAVAATIFGDPTKIHLVIVDANNKYEKLFGRKVDVLFAGDTFTLEKLIREVRWYRTFSLYLWMIAYLHLRLPFFSLF